MLCGKRQKWFAMERRVLAGRRQSGIAQLWIPIGPAPLRREVEQIPLWVDGIIVAVGPPGQGGDVLELGAPIVAVVVTIAADNHGRSDVQAPRSAPRPDGAINGGRWWEATARIAT